VRIRIVGHFQIVAADGLECEGTSAPFIGIGEDAGLPAPSQRLSSHSAVVPGTDHARRPSRQRAPGKADRNRLTPPPVDGQHFKSGAFPGVQGKDRLRHASDATAGSIICGSKTDSEPPRTTLMVDEMMETKLPLSPT
jgi:hypothetical protein